MRKVYVCPDCGDQLYPAWEGRLGCVRCLVLWTPQSPKAQVIAESKKGKGKKR